MEYSSQNIDNANKYPMIDFPRNKGDKLLGKPMYISLNANAELWIHNIKFSSCFNFRNDGISYESSKYSLLYLNEESEKFDLTNKNIEDIEVVEAINFNACHFKKEPRFKNINIEHITFIDCCFNCDISHMLIQYEKLNIEFEFIDCEFSRIMFDSFYSEKKNLYKFNINGGKIDYLEIRSIEMKNKFYINKQTKRNQKIVKINNLTIIDTVFQDNFKIHNCEVDNIFIQGVDFEKNADFFKSKFLKGSDEHYQNDNSIYFTAINFNSLALFGDTVFKEKLIFKYITFKGYNHFKSSKLNKGIDLEYTNIQNEINFYGLEIKDTSTTSQETFRIIKHQFEKLGNKIEANRYHSLELNQRLIALSNEKCKSFQKSSELLILRIHKCSSNHSSSWSLALLWIFIVGITTNLCLYDEWEMNNFFKYISILSNIEDFKSSYITMTLNKISLGYLYYQFVTAVRKDTRK